eukprot:366258-Chlamydomonas_euryale.AAC.6
MRTRAWTHHSTHPASLKAVTEHWHPSGGDTCMGGTLASSHVTQSKLGCANLPPARPHPLLQFWYVLPVLWRGHPCVPHRCSQV